jgi:flagellar protein FliO/FliZ
LNHLVFIKTVLPGHIQMQATDWFQYAFSAVVVLATLGAVLWLLVRRKNAFAPKSEGRKIKLLETMPLSLKHKLMLVQVENQMVLLSVNPQEISTLHAWQPQADNANSAATPTPPAMDFRSVMQSNL